MPDVDCDVLADMMAQNRSGCDYVTTIFDEYNSENAIHFEEYVSQYFADSFANVKNDCITFKKRSIMKYWRKRFELFKKASREMSYQEYLSDFSIYLFAEKYLKTTSGLYVYSNYTGLVSKDEFFRIILNNNLTKWRMVGFYDYHY